MNYELNTIELKDSIIEILLFIYEKYNLRNTDAFADIQQLYELLDNNTFNLDNNITLIERINSEEDSLVGAIIDLEKNKLMMCLNSIVIKIIFFRLLTIILNYYEKETGIDDYYISEFYTTINYAIQNTCRSFQRSFILEQIKLEIENKTLHLDSTIINNLYDNFLKDNYKLQYHNKKTIGRIKVPMAISKSKSVFKKQNPKKKIDPSKIFSEKRDSALISAVKDTIKEKEEKEINSLVTSIEGLLVNKSSSSNIETLLEEFNNIKIKSQQEGKVSKFDLSKLKKELEKL